MLRLLLLCMVLGPTATWAQEGEHVLGQWTDGYWYPATITSTSAWSGDYVLTFDDGDKLTVPAEKVGKDTWNIGSFVECNWLGKGKYYPGMITFRNDETLHVSYEDRDQEDTVIGRCRAKEAPPYFESEEEPVEEAPLTP